MTIKQWLRTTCFMVLGLITLMVSTAGADYSNSAITDSTDPAYWLDLGGLFATYGSYPSAVEAYKKALILDANNSKAYYNLAVAYGELGELDQALVEINRAIALEAGTGRYYYGRGWILLKAGRTAEADENFRKAAGMGDQDALAFLQQR